MNSVLKLALTLIITQSICLPVHADEYAQRGYEMLSRGSYSQAVSMLTAAVRSNPADIEVRRQLCRAYIGAGMSQQAIQQLKVIATVAPGNSSDLNMQGEAYYELGNCNAAISVFRQVLAMDPSNGAARIGLAKSHLYTGNYAQAKTACNDVLRVTRDPSVRKQAMEMLTALKGKERVHAFEKA